MKLNLTAEGCVDDVCSALKLLNILEEVIKVFEGIMFCYFQQYCYDLHYY